MTFETTPAPEIALQGQQQVNPSVPTASAVRPVEDRVDALLRGRRAYSTGKEWTAYRDGWQDRDLEAQREAERVEADLLIPAATINSDEELGRWADVVDPVAAIVLNTEEPVTVERGMEALRATYTLANGQQVLAGADALERITTAARTAAEGRAA